MSSWPPPLQVLHTGGGGDPWPRLAEAMGAQAQSASAAQAPDLTVRYEAQHALVRTRTISALDRALAVCTQSGWSWVLGEPSVGYPNAIPREAAHDTSDTTDDALVATAARETEVGRLEAQLGTEMVRQRLTLFDEAASEVTFTPGGATYRPRAAANDGLARLLADLGAVRCRRLGPDHAAAVAQLDLPQWPALAAAEAAVGGLVAPALRDPLGVPWLLAGLVAVTQAPESLRARWRWFGEEATADEELPLSMESLLSWRWHDMPMVFIGHQGELDRLAFCDDRGAIWTYQDELADVELAAGTAATWIGGIAMDRAMYAETTSWAAVHVACDSAAIVADGLGLTAVPEASDSLVAWYRGSGIWVRQAGAHRTSALDLRIVGDDLDAVVAAAKLAAQGGLAATVDAQAPGGAERADAISRAGVRVLT